MFVVSLTTQPGSSATHQKCGRTLLHLVQVLLYTPRERNQTAMTLVLDEKEIKSLPITVDPEIVSGTPVFAGTRVPIDALINNLEAGLTLDEFLDNFPSVTHEQAIQVLEFSNRSRNVSRKHF